jgi:hypothetical protein
MRGLLCACLLLGVASPALPPPNHFPPSHPLGVVGALAVHSLEDVESAELEVPREFLSRAPYRWRLRW